VQAESESEIANKYLVSRTYGYPVTQLANLPVKMQVANYRLRVTNFSILSFPWKRESIRRLLQALICQCAEMLSVNYKPETKNLFLILTTNDYSLATNFRGGVEVRNIKLGKIFFKK